jgi:predicted SprT family Zn-dependent metalloprotease
MLASAPMPLVDADLPPRLKKRLAHWLRVWDVPELGASLRIEFSPRLKRAFGRCYQEDRLIRLTPSLLDSQSHLLAEILCHEAAHAAVYERHGAEAPPHGGEWEDLMRMVGFEPRVRIPVVVKSDDKPASNGRVVYLHRCPNCELERHAARPMHDWRCRTCVRSHSEGRLVIRKKVAAKKASVARTTVTHRGRKRGAAVIGLPSRRSLCPVPKRRRD